MSASYSVFSCVGYPHTHREHFSKPTYYVVPITDVLRTLSKVPPTMDTATYLKVINDYTTLLTELRWKYSVAGVAERPALLLQIKATVVLLSTTSLEYATRQPETAARVLAFDPSAIPSFGPQIPSNGPNPAPGTFRAPAPNSEPFPLSDAPKGHP